MRCKLCELPKDLCICNELEKEYEVIPIEVQKSKWNKEITIISSNDKKLFTTLRKRLSCGGTLKDNRIILLGNHLEKVKKILIELNYKIKTKDIIT